MAAPLAHRASPIRGGCVRCVDMTAGYHCFIFLGSVCFTAHPPRRADSTSHRKRGGHGLPSRMLIEQFGAIQSQFSKGRVLTPMLLRGRRLARRAWRSRGKVRGRFALTPALSPGERENFRARFESSMASVASVALLPFRSEAAPTPGRVGFHQRRERLPLSWGRGPVLRSPARSGTEVGPG